MYKLIIIKIDIYGTCLEESSFGIPFKSKPTEIKNISLIKLALIYGGHRQY